MSKRFKIIVSIIFSLIIVLSGIGYKEYSDIVAKSEMLEQKSPEMRYITYDEMIEMIIKQDRENSTTVRKKLYPYGISENYLMITRTLKVNDFYYPSLHIFADVSKDENGNIKVNSIVHSFVDGENQLLSLGISKEYYGEIFTHIQDDKTLYYWVNGDFLDAKTKWNLNYIFFEEVVNVEI